MQYTDEQIEKMLQLKESIVDKMAKHQDELDFLQKNLDILDVVLKGSSFTKASSLPRKSEPNVETIVEKKEPNVEKENTIETNQNNSEYMYVFQIFGKTFDNVQSEIRFTKLGRITTLLQNSLDLQKFRLTRDSKYGLVGTRGISIQGEVRNARKKRVTQQLLCSKSHDFLAIFDLAHSKINQIA